MWDRISNKLLTLGGLLLLGLFLHGNLQAFPEYTSRENAIRLADVLDKGADCGPWTASTTGPRMMI